MSNNPDKCPDPNSICPSLGAHDFCYKASSSSGSSSCDDCECPDETQAACCPECGEGDYAGYTWGPGQDSQGCECRTHQCPTGYQYKYCGGSPAAILQKASDETQRWRLPNPLAKVTGSCTDGSCGTSFQITDDGGLSARLAIPTGSPFDPPMELIYNSTKIYISEFGFLWGASGLSTRNRPVIA